MNDPVLAARLREYEELARDMYLGLPVLRYADFELEGNAVEYGVPYDWEREGGL